MILLGCRFFAFKTSLSFPWALRYAGGKNISGPSVAKEIFSMPKKLYVGNLPYNTSDEELRKIFTNNGFECDEVTVIIDRDTGRSRGFGFVTLANDADVEEAISQINGFDMGGRNLKVNEAKERGEGSGGGGRGGGGRGGGGRGRY